MTSVIAGALVAGVRVPSEVRAATDGGVEKTPVYPPAPKADQVDDYHGSKVADPYRWLEDPDADQTRAWIDAENKVTFAYLAGIPAREGLRRRLTELWDYERFSVPFKRGSVYFYFKNDGLQNQDVLHVTNGIGGTPRILLDPNTLSADGTVALSGVVPSEDGKLLAYGISVSGSDWQEWKVRDVETGKDLSDHLKWVKFSDVSWTLDGKGFYYSRYDEPNEATRLQAVNYYQRLFYHRVGDPQTGDTLVYERPDQKEWGFGGSVTEDGRYLIIGVWHGTDPKSAVFYKDLTDPLSKVVELLKDWDASYNLIGNDGPIFWFRTDLNAPRGRVIAIDTQNPSRENWKEVIPEATETLQGVSVVGGRFIAEYLKDAHSQIKLFGLDGTFRREVTLPGIGSIGGFGGKRKDTETFYSFTSFTTPSSIYRYDISTGESTLYRSPKVKFNPGDFVTEQVFYSSKDGTRIPMFITHRKGLKLDGHNPIYLYGYGGFNISLTPEFRVANLVWMELGGVYAVPNLRGGGEYGEQWHLAGTKLHKQNVFDDFIAAAEWLIANRYTSTSRLAIGGGSNGGLLVGASITQRPDLFGGALAAVGVMDMLRFHKFTIGWGWTSDYGSSDNPDEFKALYAYSPLHNIKPGASYPPTLITTADHDDRVVPAHSFKFAATMQAAQSGPAPILIRIETKAGHGAGKPTTKLIEEVADRWGFLVRVLGMETTMGGIRTGEK
ncbi:MAG: S9 family peptidase [Acidobacteria bacterium]|nr:S9 family peptidase [Acidobacteriota bacterium]